MSEERLESLSERIDKLETNLDKKFEKLMDKLDGRREWEGTIEVRLTKIESFVTALTWVIGVAGGAVIIGGLSFLWAVSTGAIRIVSP